MSAPAKRLRTRGPLGVALAAVLAAALLLARERVSLERGNRLFRAGDPAAAAEIYDRSARPGGSDKALYNLGTALLAVDIDSAETVLLTATGARDRVTAQKSFYNLGYELLISTDLDPDSIEALLMRAIANNRSALRMDPADQDARWNLALAQRLLDALVPPPENPNIESGDDSDDELMMKDPSLARSDKPPEKEADVPEDTKPADSPAERRGPQEGARETWATQDPGPMTRAEALTLLQDVQDDPEALVRGIMWSRRPDVAWWSGQSSPGGRW